MIQGFKEFISKGNAVDLAVGVVIGAAFTAVVTALVEKVINPLVGGLFGKPNFDAVGQFTLGSGETAALIQPGAILTALVNLLIVGFALYFFIVVPMNKLNDLKADKAEEEEEVAEEIQLLREIRDALER